MKPSANLVRFPPIAALGATVAMLLLGSPPIASGEDAKPAAGDHFKVQIVHPARVGDRWHMRREVEQVVNETNETDGKPPSTQSGGMEINFSGTLEVLAAGRGGQPEKLKVSAGVVSVRRPGNSGHETLVKPGTEFTVTWAGGKAAVADYEAKHPLSEDARKFLPIVFEATGPRGDSSLADILDTASATQAANWSINTKAATAALHNFDPKLNPGEVSGSARIKSVVGEGDKAVLDVQYEFKATTSKPTNPPAGMTPVSATRIESGTITLPASLSTGYFSAKTLIHTTSTYKKTLNEKKSSRVGNRTVTKTVKVNQRAIIDVLDKINTLLTYDGGATADKMESPSPTTSKPATSPPQSSASESSAPSAKPAPN